MVKIGCGTHITIDEADLCLRMYLDAFKVDYRDEEASDYYLCGEVSSSQMSVALCKICQARAGLTW